MGQPVFGQLDGDGDAVAVVVEADVELRDFEQPSQQRFWGFGEVEGQVGQCIEQRGVCGGGSMWRGGVGGVE
ncbi:hypothetical protein [Nocardia brasiliensis]|uniref:hypothetical protein n=1 Tax=Nocardia brasiliensis TaxID=37326 RepID=UPI0024566808|nr:hypothetical protein [Nocardia brasiliensis]